MQRGSLYNAYGDKEAIFLHPFDLYAARFLDGVEADLRGDAAERLLRRFFEAIIANMTAGTPMRGCLTTKTAGDGSLASEPIRQRLRALLTRLTAIVEAALSRPSVRGGQAPRWPTIEIEQTFWWGKPPRLWVRPRRGASLRWRSPARPCSCRYIS